jgi:hypothetical protein
VIHDLDRTLETFLRAELPADLRDVAISFAPPDDKFPPAGTSLPAISMFLSTVQENRDLRATEPIVSRVGADQLVRRPPARIDCIYLACAFSNAETRPEEDEHRILGELMRTMLRFREIPSAALHGSLQDQVIPIRITSPMPSSRDAGIELWQAFKARPRAALHYTVTISVDPAVPTYPQPPVVAVRTSGATGEPSRPYGVDTFSAPVAIKGHVVDAVTSQPLAGALVELTAFPDAFAAHLESLASRHASVWARMMERPDRALSRPDGSFAFLSLPEGDFSLRVTLPGAGVRYGATIASGVHVARSSSEQWIPAQVDASLPPTALRGKVVDSSVQPVPMAEVRIVGSGEVAFTDRSGGYVFSAIEPGSRSIDVVAPGFEPSRVSSLRVEQGAVLTADVTLRPIES